MTKPTFDMEAALQVLREGKDLTDKDSILTPLIKQFEAVQYSVSAKHRSQNAACRQHRSFRCSIDG